MLAIFCLALLLNCKMVSKYQWSAGELVATEGLTKLGLFLAHAASAASDRTDFILLFISVVVVVVPVVAHGVIGRRSIVTISFYIKLVTMPSHEKEERGLPCSSSLSLSSMLPWTIERFGVAKNDGERRQACIRARLTCISLGAVALTSRD
jgi:hypothetical protein